MTINVGGARWLIEWVLDQAVDVVLLQEHRASKEELCGLQAMIARKGWRGVWNAADTTAKGGRSGGVAVITRGIPIFRPKNGGTSRYIRGVVNLTRTRKLNLVSVYGYDSTQADAAERNGDLRDSIQQELAALGRTQWIVGGDWNDTPENVTLFWAGEASVCATGQATQRHGKEIDWFLTTKAIGALGAAQLVEDHPSLDHDLVVLELPAFQELDLGMRVRRPAKVDDRGLQAADFR